MSTTAAEEQSAHVRAVSVTTLASLAGIVAALLSAFLVTDPTDTMGLYPFVAAVLVQYVLWNVSDLAGEFSAKDSLFVAFVTFSFWFIVWAILLTSGTSI